MNIIRYVLTRLPEKWQKKLTLYLISSGKIFTTPIWKMLFQTFSFYGGDEQKLRKTLVRKHDNIESVVNAICDLGKSTKEEADLLTQQMDSSQSNVIRDKYLEAALYYFMAYFFINEPEQSKRIFSLTSPVFDEFRKRMSPPVDQWEFKYREGKFFTHTYYPQGDGSFPVILCFPGNEGIKEHMATYAKYALARKMAFIAIDPPGWGESGLSGCKLSNIEDYKKCTDQIYDRVTKDSKLNENQIATFGVSGGSLTSTIVAGFHDYIQAVTGIGAPEYKKLATVWKNALGDQKRKTYTWTGLSSEKAAIRFLEKYAEDTEKILPNITSPVLLFHGAKDLVTKGTSGKEIADLIGTNASYRIIPGDDHLCSNKIGSGLADEIFVWLADKLGAESPIKGNIINKKLKHIQFMDKSRNEPIL